MEQVGAATIIADQPLCSELAASTQNGFLSRLKPTPCDEATGVSFPIVTSRELPPVGKSNNARGQVIADWNHTNHPRERLVRGSPIEIALRNSRVEWVHRDDHMSYHREFYGREVGTEEQVLRQVIFNAAAFIPTKGLRYDGRSEAKIVNISPRVRRELWESGRVKVAHNASIRDGILDVALRQDFNGINESTIDEFLHTPDQHRKFTLGSNLLCIALYDATAPLKPLYKEMYGRQQLRPDAPKNIGRFALNLVSHYRRTRALGALEGYLKTS